MEDNTATRRDQSATPSKRKASRRKSPKLVEPGLPLVSIGLERERTSGLLEYIEPQHRQEELVLAPRLVKTFLELLEEHQHSDRLKRHGLPVRNKLLFCGPPGCGKTITAEVFARELGVPLLVARLDAIISSFLGETATNLRKVFDEVQRTGAVLFLDEFDALAHARTDSNEHNELRRVVNSLLMMIDRYQGRGFLIAATNLETSLDPALWRRFDDVILFELPKGREIRQLLRLKTKNFASDFDLEASASKLKGWSHADIERVCHNAIKQAILGKRRIMTNADFRSAVRAETRRQWVRSRVQGAED